MRDKMDHDIQELYRENLLAEEAGVRAQIDHEKKEQGLRDRLVDVRRALEIAKRNLEDSHVNVMSLTDELNRARKSELRYKKKVGPPPVNNCHLMLTVTLVLRLEAGGCRFKEEC